MSDRTDLLNRINVLLFHFDQRLGPRLLLNAAEIRDSRVISSLTRLMDFNFLEEMKAFVNAMANVVYSSMFFPIPNPLARGGMEQLMLTTIVFEPTITEYMMISSLEEEMRKTISKMNMLPEMASVITTPNPSLKDFPELAKHLTNLRDTAISIFQDLFYGQFGEQQDAISQILGKVGTEAGRKAIQDYQKQDKEPLRTTLDRILRSSTISRWGKFSILHLDPEENVATISVRNSIWTESLGVIATKACAFIEGLLESIFKNLYNRQIRCKETRCAAEYSYVQECLFQVLPKTSGNEKTTFRELQAIMEMAKKEREETIQMIKDDIGLEIYYDLEPLIRLIQLFNKAPFISDFYFDESKFLIVCNYWTEEKICDSCEQWIQETSKVPCKLIKTEHRICELTMLEEETKEE